ncbi:MAG: effector binding domain-containing protein [Bacteroidota bacterium]
MKKSILLLNLLLSVAILAFNACTIKGEEVCGIWQVNGTHGAMRVEITPWQGKFLGYLLQYEEAGEIVVGDKTEDFIFITDLVAKGDQYQEGKLYLDPQSTTHCDLTLAWLNDHQLKAIYNCDGQTTEAIWDREGTSWSPKSVVPTSIKKKMDNQETVKTIPAKPSENVPTKDKQIAITQTDDQSQKVARFYMIGIQEQVNYEAPKAMEKGIESLWTKLYNNDFSGQLTNTIDPDKLYLSYSNYDHPQGKMTITLGYKVQDLSNVPSSLQGVAIPSNEYLVYPITDVSSDFLEDRWQQIFELMAKRRANSIDFEVYTFDQNYKVEKAEMWIATK